MINMLDVEKTADGKPVTRKMTDQEKQDNKSRVEYVDNMVKISRKDVE